MSIRGITILGDINMGNGLKVDSKGNIIVSGPQASAVPTTKTTNVEPIPIGQPLKKTVVPGKIQQNINTDWESGILTKEDSPFKFFGKPLDHKYIFDYKEYVKQTNNKGLTIGQLKSRYNIQDGDLRKTGQLCQYPGDLNICKFENHPELQKLQIPKECIENYVPEDMLK